MTTVDPLILLVDLFEQSAADGKSVLEVTGRDVAAFADDFVREEQSYKNQQREKLNEKINKRGA